MARVIFINFLYGISYDEDHRRECLQDHINSIHTKIQNESRNTNNPDYYQALYKKRFHEEMRKGVKLVTPEESNSI
jgi:hypothetical protein